MDHPDEGTIHAWLDGALSRADSVELEQHVAGCTDCASAVAEARGLVAASSRIVSELDEVPAGVLPVDSRAPSARVTGATAAADAKRVRRPEPKAARKRAWYQATGYAAAAALLLVAGNRFLTSNSAPRVNAPSQSSQVGSSSNSEPAPAQGQERAPNATAATSPSATKPLALPPASPALADAAAGAAESEARSDARIGTRTEATENVAAKDASKAVAGAVSDRSRKSASSNTPVRVAGAVALAAASTDSANVAKKLASEIREALPVAVSGQVGASVVADRNTTMSARGSSAGAASETRAFAGASATAAPPPVPAAAPRSTAVQSRKASHGAPPSLPMPAANQPSALTNKASKSVVALVGCYTIASAVRAPRPGVRTLPPRLRLTDTLAQNAGSGGWMLARSLDVSASTAGEAANLSWLPVDSTGEQLQVRIRSSSGNVATSAVFRLGDLSRIPCPTP